MVFGEMKRQKKKERKKNANQGNTTVVNKTCGNAITPVFITCDPARDAPRVVLAPRQRKGRK